jgi:hypothetical protein
MWKVNSNNEENIENKSQGTEKGKGTFDVKFNLTDESNYPIWSKLVLLMSRQHKLAKVQDSVVVFDDTTDSALFALYLNLSPERQRSLPSQYGTILNTHTQVAHILGWSLV